MKFFWFNFLLICVIDNCINIQFVNNVLCQILNHLIWKLIQFFYKNRYLQNCRDLISFKGKIFDVYLVGLASFFRASVFQFIGTSIASGGLCPWYFIWFRSYLKIGWGQWFCRKCSIQRMRCSLKDLGNGWKSVLTFFAKIPLSHFCRE